MKIAIASGKGGTGKTTVAVNLSVLLSRKNYNVTLLDCDVEAPNCHVFLDPTIIKRSVVKVKIPIIDKNLCDNCGKCSKFCEFNAISCTKEKVLIFPELCHSCGVCSYICPKQAIHEDLREVGNVIEGKKDNIRFMKGMINIGEPRSIPTIKELKKRILKEDITILDAPPGASCSVIETLCDVDFVILVTEPTAFGLHDLKKVIAIARLLKKPFSVIINKSQGASDKDVISYCNQENIPIISKIPNNRNIAELYSKNKILVEMSSEYSSYFENIWKHIEKLQLTSKENS